jgi:hypothetical protein
MELWGNTFFLAQQLSLRILRWPVSQDKLAALARDMMGRKTLVQTWRVTD